MVPVQTIRTQTLVINHGQFRIAGRWTPPCIEVQLVDGTSRWFKSLKAANAFVAAQSKGGAN